jgi:hypothetical protein
LDGFTAVLRIRGSADFTTIVGLVTALDLALGAADEEAFAGFAAEGRLVAGFSVRTFDVLLRVAFAAGRCFATSARPMLRRITRCAA